MTYKYDTREVTHGNAMGLFKISKTESWRTRSKNTIPIYRNAKTSFETSQESKADTYADNGARPSSQGKKSTEGSITTYQIPKQFMIDHLGKKLTTSTPPALIDTGVNANFIWGHAEICYR